MKKLLFVFFGSKNKKFLFRVGLFNFDFAHKKKDYMN